MLEGLVDPDGLDDADGLELGEFVDDGLDDLDGLADADGLALGEPDGDADAEGLADADGDADDELCTPTGGLYTAVASIVAPVVIVKPVLYFTSKIRVPSKVADTLVIIVPVGVRLS